MSCVSGIHDLENDTKMNPIVVVFNFVNIARPFFTTKGSGKITHYKGSIKGVDGRDPPVV